MALPASGQISLNDVNVELGNSGTAQIDMNSAAVRGLFGIASGEIEMSDGYGKANTFAFTISSNTQEANLSTLATAAGWDGSSLVEVTVSSGVYLWSDNTANPGLLVNTPCTITNNGKIIGKGGDASGKNVGTAGAGGPAIKITSSGVTVTNSSGAYIAGGGGGGATSAYDPSPGGGGAGGGRGGNGGDTTGGSGGAIGVKGGNAQAYGGMVPAQGGGSGGAGGFRRNGTAPRTAGGGGGRILPGVGGAGGYSSFFGVTTKTGGSAGNAGTNGGGEYGGGGGGWGAVGGNGTSSGGAGGDAIDDNGNSYTLTNSGTIYGVT